MRGRPRRLTIALAGPERERLDALARSGASEARTVQRARILLMADEGLGNKAICAELGVSKPTVVKTLKKCFLFGVEAALADLPRSGRPALIGMEEREWVASLARAVPQDLEDGPKASRWSVASLTAYVRLRCEEHGFPSLKSVSTYSIWDMLKERGVQLHAADARLERKDQEGEKRSETVLLLYKPLTWRVRHVEVEVEKASRGGGPCWDLFLSRGGEPGGRATGNGGSDGAPKPEKAAVLRDCERCGSVSLLAGIDLLTGEVAGLVRDTGTSRDFIDFLKLVDARYDDALAINVILENTGVHTSKEVMDHLNAGKRRFAFTFAPGRASWLNLVESFFEKLARQALKGLRVPSRQALADHVLAWLKELNETPAVFRWKGSLEDIESAFAK